MERVSSISARLKEYRETNDLTLSDLSKATGIPAQTINRYELGQRAPKIDTAVQIADCLKLNPLWLQGYNVPMHENRPAPESESGPDGPIDAHIMDMIRQLTPENKKKFAEKLEVLLEFQEPSLEHRD